MSMITSRDFERRISITPAEMLVNEGLGEKEFNCVFSPQPILGLRAFLLEVIQGLASRVMYHVVGWIN